MTELGVDHVVLAEDGAKPSHRYLVKLHMANKVFLRQPKSLVITQSWLVGMRFCELLHPAVNGIEKLHTGAPHELDSRLQFLADPSLNQGVREKRASLINDRLPEPRSQGKA